MEPFDPVAHDRYLDIIIREAPRLGEAMVLMASSAGTAARSPSDDNLESARLGFAGVSSAATGFLHRLAEAQAPDHLREADGDLQDALKLVIEGGRRGVIAADERDGAKLASVAWELDHATVKIVAVAGRITTWRSGDAAP